MPDPALQLLLDPAANGDGIITKRRVDADTLSSYFLEGQVRGKGKAMWVNVTTADSDATKATAMLAAFGVT